MHLITNLIILLLLVLLIWNHTLFSYKKWINISVIQFAIWKIAVNLIMSLCPQYKILYFWCNFFVSNEMAQEISSSHHNSGRKLNLSPGFKSRALLYVLYYISSIPRLHKVQVFQNEETVGAETARRLRSSTTTRGTEWGPGFDPRARQPKLAWSRQLGKE